MDREASAAGPNGMGPDLGLLPKEAVADRLSPQEVEEQFRRLFQHHLEKRHVTLAKAAERMQMSQRNLQRILAGDQKLTTQLLIEFGNALELDKSRAVIAIERFRDWTMYYDPTLETAVDLLCPVIERINQQGGVAEPLHPKAVDQLATWIADVILKHQEQVARRREEIGVVRRG